MQRRALFLLMISAALMLCAASPRHIDFRIRNDTMSEHKVRVRDSHCNKSLHDSCRLARDLLRSRECRESPSSGSCQRARRVLAKTDCTPGVVYAGKVKAGKAVGISSCNDGSGHAEVEISLDGGAWTRHAWIDAGQTVDIR